MSRHDRQAVVILAAASVAVKTITVVFPTTEEHNVKIEKIHGYIVEACKSWPGQPVNGKHDKYISTSLREWTRDLHHRKMCRTTLAAVATHLISDIMAKPSSRLMRPALGTIIGELEEVYSNAEKAAGGDEAYTANKNAEDIFRELYGILDFDNR